MRQGVCVRVHAVSGHCANHLEFYCPLPCCNDAEVTRAENVRAEAEERAAALSSNVTKIKLKRSFCRTCTCTSLQYYDDLNMQKHAKLSLFTNALQSLP